MSAVVANERLAALTAAGTSVWLDQLRRGMIESGELERMVEEESLRGVTSNPAIFEKAILGSPDYDEDLQRLARQGRSAREIPLRDEPGAGEAELRALVAELAPPRYFAVMATCRTPSTWTRRSGACALRFATRPAQSTTSRSD